MELPDIQGVIPRAVPRPVVFVGCDTGYAVNHAIPLLYSLDANGGGGVDAHIHVVNPAPGLGDALAAVACDLWQTELTRTSETIDLSRYDHKSQATYFACIRFMRAAQVMNASRRPLLVLDADSLVRKRLAMPAGCAVGLFLRPDHPKHMRVAAGAVLLTPEGVPFANAVAAAIGRATVDWLDGKGELSWYLDQVVLGDIFEKLGPSVHRFDTSFMDWEFGPEAVIWTGKGARKYRSEAYREELARYTSRFSVEKLRQRRWHTSRRRALILQPALDLPFKRPKRCVQCGHGVSRLRQHWQSFACQARAVLNREGWQATILERPGWELTPEFADAWAADLVLVPHRERHQFACKTPALYWMQTPIPHLFTVDPQGWGAGAGGYPFDHSAGDSSSIAYDELRARLDRNESKFDQPPRRTREALVEAGIIAAAPYIFFPCQLPHDETIRFHSDVDEAELIRRLAGWASGARVHLVLKAHPANPASMAGLRAAAGHSRYVCWLEHHVASIHDLIENAEAVYTINSGAGLEAVLHGKPVVTFGRAEYDGVAIRGDVERVGEEWRAVLAWRSDIWMPEYRRFIDWFVNHHTFDTQPGGFAVGRFLTMVTAVAGVAARAA